MYNGLAMKGLGTRLGSTNLYLIKQFNFSAALKPYNDVVMVVETMNTDHCKILNFQICKIESRIL